MRERFVEIKTAGGVMEAFVTHPEDNRPFSAVIIYMDIWGVREELYDIARRVGTAGYYCMVPDFYYCQGKRIHFEFRNEKNQTISINRLDGQALREIQARPKLSNKMVIDDTGAILEFLRGAEHVRRGAWLRATRSRRPRQAGNGARLGDDLRDVSSADPALGCLSRRVASGGACEKNDNFRETEQPPPTQVDTSALISDKGRVQAG